MNVFGKYVDYLAYHCDDCGSTFATSVEPLSYIHYLTFSGIIGI